MYSNYFDHFILLFPANSVPVCPCMVKRRGTTCTCIHVQIRRWFGRFGRFFQITVCCDYSWTSSQSGWIENNFEQQFQILLQVSNWFYVRALTGPFKLLIFFDLTCLNVCSGLVSYFTVNLSPNLKSFAEL